MPSRGRGPDSPRQLVAGARERPGLPRARFDPGIFDIQGIAPVAYSVFAVALGIAAGAAFRRVLPAMAITFAVFAGLRFLIAEFARPHYLTPASMLIPFGPDIGPSGSWVLPSVVTGPGGHRYGSFTFQDVPAACRSLWPTPSYPSCMTAHGYRDLITYQAAGRFWAFRLVLARDA